ncbi:hypothetical protein CH063_08880 [Colletotrichum higginsianum]|uniref:Uncharacterized protein n=4 Tax=Colletotrichum destructivum species complex TaxID=2707350 RepID=H1VBI0_COLHI|nr:hypothetical protein CH63R_01470 [Colletotrichum higginsianum IMI 349063]TID04898.1 hypothetical protein CH35J_002004 [Colletotrichum higginsianum]TQN69456.1 hypothetical protein CSHISOI_06030 [Colletotrichum shisoi]OBR16290.1 hypothetical protein CH63R_01470 [Colletotrichum higginsianum IMI 349063]CCF37583.1 hypothetical protein CH063_08880 [Colletotrichum higginsianum]GJC91463.1 hypothetical protein ColKHC_00289 [Colletotrichum higginsianum]
MAPGIIERIQQKIELFRLEQRYTRRRHRRSTFVSNAVYVDGEYVYQTPTSTGSSSTATTNTKESTSPRVNALHHAEPASPTEAISSQTEPSKKRLSRFASMSGFSSSNKQSPAQDWRSSRVSVSEIRR